MSSQKCFVTLSNDMGHYMPEYKWVPDINDQQSRSRLESQIYPEIWNAVKSDIDVISKYSYGGYARIYKPKINKKTLKISSRFSTIDVEVTLQ